MAKTLMLLCTNVNVVMGFLYTICRRILAPDVLKAAYGLTEPMTEHILYWKKPAYFWIEGCLVWNG